MSQLTALSLSIAVLGGIATFFALGPLSGVFFIWGAFVAWGAFFALGGDNDALKNTIVCGIFGVIMAWLAAVVIMNVPGAAAIGLPLWGGIVVLVTVFILCMAANIPALAAIPATVFGYAPTFAYLLQTPDKLGNDVLLGATWSNPLLVVSASIIVGAVLGMLSGKLGAAMTKEVSEEEQEATLAERKKRAEEKMKKGEKLTTEDILAMQGD
jgi:hypothetical protein